MAVTGAARKQAGIYYDKGGAVLNVQHPDFGARADGILDDWTAVQSACDAAAIVGGTVVLPATTCRMSAALNIKKNTRLVGTRKASVLLFTNATDGIVISDIGNPFPQGIKLDGFSLQTSNAAGGKAIYVNTPTNGASGNTFHDIDVFQSGSGRWAFGLWASNFESAEIYSLHIFNCATIAIHLELFCNALKFYGTEITGGNVADLTFLRGIEILGTTDAAFFGTTVQGSFGQSCINMSGGGMGAIFNFVHVENTNAAPSDGADVIVNGCSDTCLNDFQGGSILYTGTIRGGTVKGGNLGAVTFGAGCQGAILLGCRVVSITDNAGHNGWIDCRNASGGQIADKFAFPDRLIPTSTGVAPVVGTPNSSAIEAWPNGSVVSVKDTGGTYRDVWIPLSGASQMILSYLAATGAMIFRSTTPVTRMQINDAGVGIGAAGTLLVEVKKYSPSLTPASVAANSVVEQSFACTGLVPGDHCSVSGPAPVAGTACIGARCGVADNVILTFVNTTAGALTPSAGFYRITQIR